MKHLQGITLFVLGSLWRCSLLSQCRELKVVRDGTSCGDVNVVLRDCVHGNDSYILHDIGFYSNTIRHGSIVEASEVSVLLDVIVFSDSVNAAASLIAFRDLESKGPVLMCLMLDMQFDRIACNHYSHNEIKLHQLEEGEHVLHAWLEDPFKQAIDCSSPAHYIKFGISREKSDFDQLSYLSPTPDVKILSPRDRSSLDVDGNRLELELRPSQLGSSLDSICPLRLVIEVDTRVVHISELSQPPMGNLHSDRALTLSVELGHLIGEGSGIHIIEAYMASLCYDQQKRSEEDADKSRPKVDQSRMIVEDRPRDVLESGLGSTPRQGAEDREGGGLVLPIPSQSAATTDRVQNRTNKEGGLEGVGYTPVGSRAMVSVYCRPSPYHRRRSGSLTEVPGPNTVPETSLSTAAEGAMMRFASGRESVSTVSDNKSRVQAHGCRDPGINAGSVERDTGAIESTVPVHKMRMTRVHNISAGSTRPPTGKGDIAGVDRNGCVETDENDIMDRSGMVVVTAANSPYHRRVANLVGSLHYWEPGLHIFLWDIGLALNQLLESLTWEGVSVLCFPLEILPPHFADPRKVAYKAWMVQEALKEYPRVLWLDANTEIRRPLDEVLHYMGPANSGPEHCGDANGNGYFLTVSGRSFPSGINIRGHTKDHFGCTVPDHFQMECTSAFMGFVKGSWGHLNLLNPMAEGCWDPKVLWPEDATFINQRRDQSVLNSIICAAQQKEQQRHPRGRPVICHAEKKYWAYADQSESLVTEDERDFNEVLFFSRRGMEPKPYISYIKLAGD